ncbi:MAG TPA: type II secretion system F family protein [Terriglobia bacterium]|nr:type II secretion system F family protein [Terriglobia bacterium]
MLFAACAVTFVATVTIVLGLIYTLSPHVSEAASERLVRLWRPADPETRQEFRQKQRHQLQQFLIKIGKLIPSSGKVAGTAKQMLVRAGYRRPEAVMALQGAKLMLPLLFFGVAYFTGAYRADPMFILVLAAALGYALPGIWLGRKVKKRQKILCVSLPDALDLLVVCVEAGLGLDQALMRVAQELRVAHPDLCDELDMVAAEIRVGKTRIEALRELSTRTGVDDIKSWVAMLVQTDRFGTSVAQSLRVYSDDLRTKRRQRAEEMAAKTTVKMVPALVFFIFPALFAVLLGPAAISIYRTFVTKTPGG